MDTPQRLTALLITAAALVVAGCGAGSTTTVGAAAPNTGRATAVKSTTGGGAAVKGATGSRTTDFGAPSGLAFSKCMRANGAPNFPDPQPGGGLMFRANPSEVNSPAFRHGRVVCDRYLPGGGPNGPGGPGAPTHPTAQEMSMMRRISVCMRSHGIAQFPDPRTSVPASAGGLLPPGINELSNINDVILLFPSSINQQSPAFVQAANACGFPLHNH